MADVVIPWFGPEQYPRSANQRVETPVGEMCLWCTDPIVDGDSGTLQGCIEIDEHNEPIGELRAIHAWCMARSVLGSIGHLLKKCTCFVAAGADDSFHDPPGLSTQDAAKEVWEYMTTDDYRRAWGIAS